MRGEVGLLTRNILIKGETEKNCYGNNWCQYFSFDTYGGHIKVIGLMMMNTSMDIDWIAIGSCMFMVIPWVFGSNVVFTYFFTAQTQQIFAEPIHTCIYQLSRVFVRLAV